MEAVDHFHGVAYAAFDMPFERNVEGLACDSGGECGCFAESVAGQVDAV